ncbi:MAG: matrixin family metalloprotease [Marmoricola sp.]
MRTALVGVATVLVLAIVVVARAGGVSALGGGGDPDSYTFLDHQADSGAPITYSSCRPIPVEFNLNGVDDQKTTRSILLEAMGEASAASHLNLVFAGDSMRRPRPGGATMQGYPVLIAFADTAEMPTMDGAAGRGGSSWIEDGRSRRYISGQIVLEKSYWNEHLDDWRGKETARAIVMHELGHVLGLGHVDDDHQIMSKSGSGTYEYGAGDRAGLAILGRGPCA